MPQAITKTVEKIQDRADKLRGLVPDDTHPQVRLLVQKAYAGLMTCAEFLTQLEPAAASYVDQKVDAAKKNPAPAATFNVRMSSVVVVSSLPELLGSATLLSQGKDSEVLKHLGKKGLELAIKLGVRVSGIEYLKDAAELVEALQDVAETGQLIKLRKQQARVATDLFRWLDGLTLICLTWNYAAQLFLLGTEGKGDLPEDEVLTLVIEHTAKSSQKWHDLH